MWFGKVSIIMYVFSLSLIFFTYYTNQVFHDPWITNNVTFQNLNATLSGFSFNQQINIGLIFGDFYHVFIFLANLMTGSIFQIGLGDFGVVHHTGYVDQSVGLLIALIFDSATVFLILYIISNRSL